MSIQTLVFVKQLALTACCFYLFHAKLMQVPKGTRPHCSVRSSSVYLFSVAMMQFRHEQIYVHINVVFSFLCDLLRGFH